MEQNPMDQRTDPKALADEPTDERARIALRTASTMLLPLARWLLRHGVHYTSAAAALKPVFVEAARRELEATGAKLTDSAVSVLSGVHRRDIRSLGRDDAGAADPQPKTPSVASQVFTRWMADPRFRDRRNRPMTLPKSGEAPSFDALAREVSSDVHPRTLMAEMLRAGLVEVEGDRVALRGEAFLPDAGFDDRAAMFSANLHDHIAAAASNLGSAEARFLEQSVFGSGLSARSTDALGETARHLWATAFESMVREATQRYEKDRAEPDARMRMRFGVYYYAEPDTELVDTARKAPPAR
jgi:hypothetical protein